MFWQAIVRNWIAKTAKERLYEELARAEGAPDESQPRERHCDVGIVFALPIERGAMEDRLDGVLRVESAQLVARQGGLRGRHVILIDSESGMPRARQAAELLIAAHRPAWVISAGMAGGLARELNRGDILMAERVCDEADHSLAIDLQIDPAELAKHPRVHVGRLLTVDRVVDAPDEKRALGERHQALAVDCESFAVAEACRAAETRFLAVRAILDTVEERLPSELARLSRTKGHARRAGGMLNAVWNRPSAAKELIAWQEHSLTVADRLAKFLESVVTQITSV